MMKSRYTQEQRQFLNEAIPLYSNQEVAARFEAQFNVSISAAAVHSYASNHQIKKTFQRKLTDEQIQFIKANGLGNNDATLTVLFNERFGTDYPIKKIMFIRYKHGAVSGLKTRVPNSGQFQKGHVPYNKGLEQTDFMSPEAIERTKATRFQPGSCPLNHKPIGSERINVYGYIEVKIAEPNKWRLKHQIVWEEYHGKTKDDEMVIFLNGDKTNCNIENLALITKSVNARLNQGHLRFANPEFTKTGIAIAKLITKTSEVSNHIYKTKRRGT